jgi:hypothetical protein
MLRTGVILAILASSLVLSPDYLQEEVPYGTIGPLICASHQHCTIMGDDACGLVQLFGRSAATFGQQVHCG